MIILQKYTYQTHGKILTYDTLSYSEVKIKFCIFFSYKLNEKKTKMKENRFL